jgi:hypothetical protein
MTTIKTILLALAGLLVITLGNSAKAQEVFTAEELTALSAVVDNDATFAQLKNGTLKVKGRVCQSVRMDEYGRYSLQLQGLALGNYRVNISFPASSTYTFATVQIGDEITVEGRCLGRGGDVYNVETTTTRRNTVITKSEDIELKNVVFLDNCTLLGHNTGAEIENNAKDAALSKMEEEQKNELQRLKRERRESAAQRARWESDTQQERQRLSELRQSERLEAQRRQKLQNELRRNLVEGTYTSFGGALTQRLDLTGDLRPNYSDGQEEGLIVIQVVVDPKGNVQKAQIVEKQTTIKDQSLRTGALAAIQRQKFPDIGRTWKPTATYTFSHPE